MTNFSGALMGIGLAQSPSESSLRTQGPITPGPKLEKRPLPRRRNERPRRMGPCVRRDDSLIRHAYENSICETPAIAAALGDWFETQLTCWQASPPNCGCGTPPQRSRLWQAPASESKLRHG